MNAPRATRPARWPGTADALFPPREGRRRWIPAWPRRPGQRGPLRPPVRPVSLRRRCDLPRV